MSKGIKSDTKSSVIKEESSSPESETKPKKYYTAEDRKKEVAEYRKKGLLFGRPVLYKDEYPQMLIDHMKKGFSFRSFAGVIEVNFDTIYRWLEEYPDFYDAKTIGECSQLNYDEKLLDELSKGLHGKSASSATHIFKMKNCHKWMDKVEVEQTNKNIEIKIDSDDSTL